MKFINTVIWLPTLWLLMISTHASEVSYTPLTNVVKDAQCILQAKVLDVRRTAIPEGNRVEYLVEPTAVLKGIPPTPSKVRLSYFEATPVIKDKDGKVITSYSPIFTGSGEEFSIEAGQEWIFFVVANELPEDETITILRAESVTNKKGIRKILSK